MKTDEHILVVDDDPALQDALKDALEDAGFSVSLAGNGIEAISALRQGLRPVAVLLDYMMPMMDGSSFAAEVAKDPSLRALPIILLTADARAKEKAEKLGLKSYLRKPVKIDQLLSVITQARGS